jgi:hypothetical protein
MPDCETGYLTGMPLQDDAPVTNEDRTKWNRATFASLVSNCGCYKCRGAKLLIG